MRYLLIDSSNTFHRAMHVTKGPIDMRSAMSLHIYMMSIAQAWKAFNADHVVIALECPNKDNWRKEVDTRYKNNRVEMRAAQTNKEKEDSDYMYSVYNDFLDFLKDKTNLSVLQCPIAEADDMIAHWITTHKDDQHVILSSDKDFRQLAADNVAQFNGIDKKIFTTESSTIGSDINDKRHLPHGFTLHTVEDPEYLLFEKIIRGDSGDNVFSSFPGVRKKGAKDKPGIDKAYADRFSKGFDWNNFMMSRWTDHNGKDHLVKNDFLRNKKLVDLTAHPEHVVEAMDKAIQEEMKQEQATNVGFQFFKICNKYELEQLMNRAEEMSKILSAGYVNE